MSGGVDSSSAAVLLKDGGYDVVGCAMQLWDYRRNPTRGGEPQFGRCCSLDDVYDARRVAEHLGFPFYVLNLEKQFERQVIEPFIGSYLAGLTPIPCVLCNTFLKFDKLLLFARQIGIEKVATGHYARVRHDPGDGYGLLRGQDARKDQSYYLFELSQEQLSHILFPVGDYAKPSIRQIAQSHGLLTAAKHDSQEICFVPDRDYAGFIRRHAGEISEEFLPVLQDRQSPGPILFKDGTQLGSHNGIFQFTVGQRRGLRVAHPRPLYVLRLDPAQNTVVVGYKEDLYSDGLVAERVNWISDRLPDGPVSTQVKIRANHEAAAAQVCLEPAADSEDQKPAIQATVLFCEPQMSVTPGQAAVFYDGDRVLGGGWIRSKI